MTEKIAIGYGGHVDLGNCPHGVPCPKCGAPVMENCRTRNGNKASWWQPHRERYRAFSRELNRLEDELIAQRERQRQTRTVEVRVPKTSWTWHAESNRGAA